MTYYILSLYLLYTIFLPVSGVLSVRRSCSQSTAAPDMSCRHSVLNESTDSHHSIDSHQPLIVSDDQRPKTGRYGFFGRSLEPSGTTCTPGVVRSSCHQGWKPVTLKTPVLVSVIVISVGLIAAVQYLVSRSKRNNGILFSEDISSLSLSCSFRHLYAPTLIAVVYSFL